MKFLPLLFANLLRRKVRTTLTLGSFAVALFLFCHLVTIRTAFNSVYETAQRYSTDMRTGAYILAVDRVAEATRVRGIFP